MLNLDLVNKHRAELRFALILKQKSTGLYVTKSGLTEDRKRALFYETNANGANFEDVVNAFNEHQVNPWLSTANEWEFEVESELA